MSNSVHTTRKRRLQRVRAKIAAVSDRPRLQVQRSLRFLSIQVIDDRAGHTIASAHEKQFSSQKNRDERIAEMAKKVGEQLKAAKVNAVVFDRGRYAYHGTVAKVAEAVRQVGIDF